MCSGREQARFCPADQCRTHELLHVNAASVGGEALCGFLAGNYLKAPGVCHLFSRPLFVFPDIPDDEAQYWTGKLERINSMGIDDEVKTKLC